MSDIPEQRINIQSEEARSKASTAESLMTRVGAAINHINKRQFDSRGFFLNGPYSIIGVQTGVDGAWLVPFDVEIIAIAMFNLVAGSSGVTTLDVRRFTASNTPAGGASIFSTKPSIPSTAGPNVFLFRDFLNDVNLEMPVGVTAPVLDNPDALTYNLNRGDMVTLNKDASQVGGQNCGLMIFFRPR